MTRKTDEDPEMAAAVATVQDAIGTVVPREHDVLSRYLAKEVDDITVSPDATHSAIIQEILGAETVDDVLEVWEPQKLDDFVGARLTLLSFEMNDSDFASGAPVYASVRVLNVLDGTKHLINTGEQSIMAQLMRLKELGAFPIDVIPIQASRPNRHGRYLMRLKKAEV